MRVEANYGRLYKGTVPVQIGTILGSGTCFDAFEGIIKEQKYVIKIEKLAGAADRESNILSKISGTDQNLPKIVAVGVDVEGGKRILVEEPLGKSLHTLSLPVAPTMVCNVAASILLALQTLHHVGYIHGDVSDSNIIAVDTHLDGKQNNMS